jgi:hypothetical protein
MNSYLAGTSGIPSDSVSATQIYVDLKLKFDQYSKLNMFIQMSEEYWLACEPVWHRGELIYEKKSNRELIYEKKSSHQLI